MSKEREERIKRQKSIAWSIAVETCLQSKEDPVLIYERLMKANRSKDEG